MATHSNKKLTRYTSAVTVITAEVMNSIYGGEFGHRFDLDEFHPLVGGHVHDGESADGHSSKVLLTNGEHIRGYLSHANLGGTDDTSPAVQKVNVQAYSEEVFGSNAKDNAIPEYEIDSDTGYRSYYLDLSMTIGGVDKSVQYNKEGEFEGDATFVYDYDQGYLGIGLSSPSSELDVLGNGSFSGNLSVGGKLDVGGLIDPTGLILTEEAPENVPTSSQEGAIFVSDGSTALDTDGKPLEKNRLYYKDGLGSIIDMRGARNLSQLGDLSVPNPSDGDIIKYDDASDRWVSQQEVTARPGGSEGSIQINSSNSFSGSSIFVINGQQNTGLGEPNPMRRLHVKGPFEYPPIRVDSLTAGPGAKVLWDPSSKDLFYESHDMVSPKVYQWNANGENIVLTGQDRAKFIIIEGEWNSSGKIIVPKSLQADSWSTGDYLWIKNMTTYTSQSLSGGSGGTYTVAVDSSGHMASSNNTTSSNHIPIQIVGEAGDTLDGEDFAVPYILHPKNAIKFCCISSSSNNSWFLMSHYHEAQHDRPPVARITAHTSESGPLNNGDTIFTGGYLNFSGAESSDQDGDSITYQWELYSDGQSIGTDGGQTISLDTYTYPDSQILATLVVVAAGASSQQDSFTINIAQANRAPTANIEGPRNVGEGTQAVLSASKSFDLDGDTLSYSWSLQSQPSSSSYSIADSTLESIAFTPDKPGDYVFSLTVSDGSESNNPVFHTVTMDARPTITLSGQSYVEVVEGDSYSDAGATAYDFEDLNITGNISVDTGGLNTSVPNTYVISYNVIDSFGQSADEITRTVAVVENQKPVINLVGDSTMVVAKGASFVDPGVTVTDDRDMSIDPDVTGTVNTAFPDTYIISYNAIDSGGKSADTVTRTVIVNEKPVITLMGEPTMVVAQGSVYSELGATISDDRDNDIPLSITGTVNTASSGTYTIYYNATDGDGLAADQVTRSVRVNEPPVITINGPSEQTVVFDGTYVELGASVVDDHDESVSVVTTGTVNTSKAGTYIINYDATDSDGLSAERRARTVVVQPRQNVGPNVGTISLTGTKEPDSQLNLSATITDEDGYIKSYVWTITAPNGANYTLNPSAEQAGNFGSPHGVAATFITDSEGSYTARLTAKDNDNDEDSNTKTFNIIAPAKNAPPDTDIKIWQGKVGSVDSTILNEAPYSDYGASTSISINGGISNTIIFNSFSTSDSDGTVAEWNWMINKAPKNSAYSIPSIIGVLNPSVSQSPLIGYYTSSLKRIFFWFMPDERGTYEIMFRAKDDQGQSSDLVTITIVV